MHDIYIYHSILLLPSLPDKINGGWLKIVGPSRYYLRAWVYLSMTLRVPMYGVFTAKKYINFEIGQRDMSCRGTEKRIQNVVVFLTHRVTTSWTNECLVIRSGDKIICLIVYKESISCVLKECAIREYYSKYRKYNSKRLDKS